MDASERRTLKKRVRSGRGGLPNISPEIPFEKDGGAGLYGRR